MDSSKQGQRAHYDKTGKDGGLQTNDVLVLAANFLQEHNKVIWMAYLATVKKKKKMLGVGARPGKNNRPSVNLPFHHCELQCSSYLSPRVQRRKK